MKYAYLFLTITLLQACDHPLEIVGEGDITEVTGSGRGCTLEQFQAQEKTCTKNKVVFAYNVSYLPIARKGWEFAYWEGFCFPDSEEPSCDFNVKAKMVKKYWFKSAPALRAVFTDAGPWFPDEDGDGYGDGSEKGFEGAQPDPSYVEDNSDCDDGNGNINPDATEAADMVDNNCDGTVDENTKYVFVSERYNGDLGGLAGADAKCQAEADNATTPLPGVYFAYLSTSTVDARDRVSYSEGESYQWRQVDGLLLANCWSCFYDDGFLNHSARLYLDENGESTSSWPYVWTSTINGGTKNAANSAYCSDWTSDSHSLQGTLGSTSDLDPGKWQQLNANYECNVGNRLYCLQR